MADISSAQSGNWSDPVTWVGGILPSVNDVAITQHVVVIDQDISVQSIKQSDTAGSKFIINDIPSLRTLDLSVELRAGKGGNFLEITALSGSLVINTPNVYAGNASGSDAIIIDGPVDVTINGNVWGGASNSTVGIIVVASGITLTVNGDVSAGGGSSAHGIQLDVTASDTTLIINGNCSGGASSGRALTTLASGSTITIIGNLTCGNADCLYFGSQAVGTMVEVDGEISGTGIYWGINSAATTTITVLNGPVRQGISCTNSSSILDVQAPIYADNNRNGVYTNGALRATGPLYNAPNGRAAILTNFLVVPEGENFQWHCTDDSMYPLDGAPVVLSNFVSDSPPPADVRAGVTYGIEGALTGAAVIPSADSVRAGVPVDTEVGTAVVSPSDIWDHEISEGVSAKARLMATSTDESTAAILEGALDHGE